MSRPDNLDTAAAAAGGAVAIPSAGSQIAVIGKAGQVLDALLEHPEGATPTDIAAALGINRSTAFRLLISLEHVGLLDRDAETGQYRLGLKLLVFGEAVRERQDLVRIAEPTMRRLRDELRQSVYLSRREGWGAVCLHRLSGPDVDVLAWKAGRWLPFHVGAGPRALLAALSDADLADYLALPEERATRNGALNVADLRRIVDETRERGWSFNDEAITEGVSSLGAVVRGGNRLPLCALSVAGLSVSYRGERRTAIAEAVVAAAEQLAERIAGGR